MIKDSFYDRGIAVRRDMFGPAGAEQMTDNASAFTDELQDIVTRHCFGDIWSRDGLDRRDRSLVTLAMLVALGRSHEIGIHTRGALANGVTSDELRELLIHSSLYCGIPSAFDGFRVVEPIVDEAAGKENVA
jgi:4-carboxymuconolactone decarboxylase